MNFWHALPRPIIGLSPMDGVTDAAFRRVVASLGRPDVMFTEFTNVGDVCRGPDATLSSLFYSEAERPIVAQLYGKQPDVFYQAAHVVCELGFDGVDINMGCPSKNVASSGSGAGLIRTPDLAHAIIRAVQEGVRDWSKGQTLEAAGIKPSRADLVRSLNVSRCGTASAVRRGIPVSVKTRLGYDSVIVERWVAHLLQQAPAAISLHGRTLEQMYRGEADWGAIARAVRLVKGTETLLLGNGDVQSMREVVHRVRETAVHGILVGRGALGSPWFFRSKDTAREAARVAHDDGCRDETEELASIRLSVRFRVMIDHAHQFDAIFGRARFPRMRKHLGWYCKGFPHAAALRSRMVRASSPEDVERFVADHEQQSAASAPRAALSCEASPQPGPIPTPAPCV